MFGSHREEAVAESGGCGMYSPVLSARWQEGEKSMIGVGGDMLIASGLGDTM